MDHDLLACGDATDRRDRAKGGGDAAAERRRDIGIHIVGQPDEIDVGGGQGDVLREATPAIESGLPLVRAHLMIARLAHQAAPARADKGDRDAITRSPASDLGSHLRDRAGELVAGDVGKRRYVVMPVPGMPVAAAQPGCLDADDDTVRWRSRVVDLGHMQGSPEGVVDDGAHGVKAMPAFA